METHTCTLTIKNDSEAEYEDDLTHRRADGNHVVGTLGGSRLTREVAQMLHSWIGEHPECRRREFEVLGRALYEIAFASSDSLGKQPGEIRRAFESAYTLHKRLKYPLRLRLVVEQDATELAGLPWEFLYMPPAEGENDGAFLASDRTELILTRFVPNADQFTPPSDDDEGRLRILVVVSRPSIPGMTEIDVDRFRDVVRGLAESDPTRFDIDEPLESPDRERLRARIDAFRPHIIHFIGHGRPGQLALRKDERTLAADRDAREDAIARGERPEPASEADWTDITTASAILRTGLHRTNVPSRLVFLHSCQGAAPVLDRRTLQGFSDLARALVSAEGVSGVVAMQYSITTSQAEQFATVFYNALSEGRPVDEAVTVARVQLATRPAGGRQYWDDRGFGTPVIYLRREEPIVRRRLTPSRIPESPPAAGAGSVKEPCPNPRCPDGFVLRTAKPDSAFCRVCKRPFRECPRPECRGLIVPVEGFGCTECTYEWPGPETVAVGASPSAPAHAAAVGGFVDAPTRHSSRLGSPSGAAVTSISRYHPYADDQS